MDHEEFRQYGYQLVDWLVDYYDNLENRPVKPEVSPGDIKAQLPSSPPKKSEDIEQILSDFQKTIVPGLTHWQHPNFYAYFPANTSPPSILGDFLASGLGVLGMLWQTSPAATELEEVVMDWLRQMLGLPSHFHGVIQDNASTATLCALLTARETATDFKANAEGLKHPLTVYTSQEAHSSVEKGAKIAGFGKNNIRFIPTDEDYAMIPTKLKEAIWQDQSDGFIPACVVATVGTTSSTAVDPVHEIGQICQEHNIWYHVDAAFAGNAAILDEKQYLLDGVELANSCVVNPHKWLLTNFDCSAFYVSDPNKLVNTLSILPEYLKTNVDEEVKNYRDWGIQLGRGFRALKLWFVLRNYGQEGLQQILKNHIDMAQYFKAKVEAHSEFEVMAPAPVSLVCFRFNDGQHTNEELNQLNKDLLDMINQSGKAFLSHTVLDDSYVIRMAIGQRITELHHVEATWHLIQEKAKQLNI